MSVIQNKEPTEENQPTTAEIYATSITYNEPVDIQDATPKRQPIKKETPEHVESDSVPKAKPKRKPKNIKHMEVVVAPTEYVDDSPPVEETLEQPVAKPKAKSRGKTIVKEPA